jgi:hypothetical protein
MSRTSDFGSGYATCLRQFTFHRARLEDDAVLYAEMARKYPGQFGDAGAAEIWADGASHHLYELHRPRRGVSASAWRTAAGLQARALDIGHGFRPSSKASVAECRDLLDIADALLSQLDALGYEVATLGDCLNTDHALGLAALPGTWSCSEDITRRKTAAQ